MGARHELPLASGCWSPLSEEVGSRNGNSPPSPPPPAGPSPPPPPLRLFTSSLNFICATLAGMRTLKKKKNHSLSTRQQLRRSHVASSHRKGGKKVLLATQTWRNSSDMPVSRSSPTFLRSPLSFLAGSRRPLAGGGKGAPGECEGGRQKSPPGK